MTPIPLQKWLSDRLPSVLWGIVQLDADSLQSGGISWDRSEVAELRSEALRYRLVHERIVMEVTLEADADYHAVVVKQKLIGTSDNPIALQDLEPVRLTWQTAGELAVRTVNGGTTEEYYPPRAYAERTVKGRFIKGVVEIRSGDDGRSSNRDLPVMLTAVQHGGVVAAMEWSGTWKQSAATDPVRGCHNHTLTIPVNGLILENQEVLELPAVHLVFYEGDPDQGSNEFRRYVYDRICPNLANERPLPPISYDHWFGIRNEFDERFLRQLIDRSALLGLDYFVVDAGWFPMGFHPGVGNWRVDPAKLPDGLEPVMDYVRSKGMKPGLWFEIERAHKKSDSYAAHPEWFISINHGPDPKLRDYALLDLSLKPAQEWAIQTIGSWIERLGLKWSRLDYNIGPLPYWEKLDPSGKKMFRYVEGLYRVLDELMRRYPDWLIEGCASGGRRIDLGTLKRAHTYWFSDETVDPHNCRFMQSGANRFLPAHLLNSAVTVKAIGAGDNGMADLDVVSRMLGALSFNGDISSWSESWTARCRELVEKYRSLRTTLLGDFYPLTPSPCGHRQPEAVQFVSRDKRKALVFAFIPEGTFVWTNKLYGLSEDGAYKVSDPFHNQISEMHGSALMSEGLKIEAHSGEAFVRIIEII